MKNKWRTFLRRQQVKAILEGAATDLSRLLHTCLSGEPHNNNMLNIQVSCPGWRICNTDPRIAFPRKFYRWALRPYLPVSLFCPPPPPCPSIDSFAEFLDPPNPCRWGERKFRSGAGLRGSKLIVTDFFSWEGRIRSGVQVRIGGLWMPVRIRVSDPHWSNTDPDPVFFSTCWSGSGSRFSSVNYIHRELFKVIFFPSLNLFMRKNVKNTFLQIYFK